MDPARFIAALGKKLNLALLGQRCNKTEINVGGKEKLTFSVFDKVIRFQLGSATHEEPIPKGTDGGYNVARAVFHSWIKNPGLRLRS